MNTASSSSDGPTTDAVRVRTPSRLRVLAVEDDVELIELLRTSLRSVALTLNLEVEDPTLANAAVATEVVADIPLIVERAQYWPDPVPTWHEAHNSFGVTSLATRWGLAEGRVGGEAEYQTYVLLANPQPVGAEVTIEFLGETGPPVTKAFTVPMF